MKIELGSTGFILTLVFIALKVFKVVNWSWLWVLSPILITLGITLLMLVFAFGIIVLGTILGGKVTIKKKI
jgi:hypothetical protein